MLKKQKKLSRKEIKEDKLVDLYYKSQNFFEENKNKVFLYAGALAVVVIAVILFLNYRSNQNEAAGTQLANVMDTYDAGAYLEAIEGKQGTNILGLKKIVQDYGSTENGETAKIYLANCYSNLGKPEEALKYYEDYSGSIDLYQAAALAGQASIFASKNDYAKAADLYLKASKVSKNNILDADYIFQAAINFIESGDKDQAKNLLQTIKDEYKTSAVNAQVDRYLSQLN